MMRMLMMVWTCSIDLADAVVDLEFDGLNWDGIRRRRLMTFRKIIWFRHDSEFRFYRIGKTEITFLCIDKNGTFC